MIEFVEIDGPNGTLRGTAHIPEGSEDHPVPGVVMLHGFTGQRMEAGFLFVQCSRRLEMAGIASLRMDFWGSGESDGAFEQMTATTEQADAAAMIEGLKSHPRIDPDRVGLMGMSFGGFHAACVLGERDDLRAGVLWCPAGQILQRWGERLTPELARHLEEHGWIDWAGHRLGRGFFGDLERYDSQQRVADYDGPVLVLHARDDQTVPLAEAERYVDVLESRPSGECEHEFFDEGGHPFAKVATRERLWERTVDWFVRYL